MQIRYLNLGVVTPHGFRAENLLLAQMSESELRTLTVLIPVTDGSRRDDNNVLEYLLRQIPVFGSRASPNVAWRIESGNEHPSIVKHSLRIKRI